MKYLDKKEEKTEDYLSLQQLNKKDIQDIKRKAQEADLKMNRRKRAVMKIQKMWRGFICRKKFLKMK